MVAVGLFIMAFSLVTVYLAGFAENARSSSATDLDSVADDVLTLAMGGPGTPADWDDDGGSPDRCGLMKEGTTSTVDLGKLQRFHEGTDQVSYGDARACFGADPNEVHLRTRPRIDDVDEALDGYRVAYVGQYDTDLIAGGWVHDEESDTLAETPVSYNDTPADQPVSLDDPGDKYRDDTSWFELHLGPRLAGALWNEDDTSAVDDLVGGEATNWRVVDLSNHTGITWDADQRYVLSTSRENPDWNGNSVCSGDQKCYMTYEKASSDRLVVAHLDLTGFDGDDELWLNFTHYADGTKNNTDHDYGRVQVKDVDAPSWSALNPASPVSYDGGANNSADGDHDRFQIERRSDLANHAGSDIHLAFTWVSDDDGLLEPDRRGMGWFLGGITVEGVRDGEHVTLYDNPMDLAPGSSGYDALYVGTDVDQSTLAPETDMDVHSTLRAWVEAGGDIMAAGGTGLNATWVEPLVTGAPNPANGPLLEDASDLSHPVLLEPHGLPHRSWSASDDTYGVTETDTFTRVLLRSDGAGSELPILAVSNPNRAFDGDTLFTSWTPHTIEDDERQQLYENAYMYLRYRELYLDYGGTVPAGADVGSATTRGLVDATDLDLGYVNFEVTFYVWR